jgi:hypothetical protein
MTGGDGYFAAPANASGFARIIQCVRICTQLHLALPPLTTCTTQEMCCHTLKMALYSHNGSVKEPRTLRKLSAFIDVLAEATGMPRSSVEQYVKPLRKARLLTTGGRGAGAPDIDAGDCARLLVALMAGSPTHAVEFVQEIGRLPPAFSHDSAVAKAWGLPRRHTFLDMLTELLARAAAGTLLETLTQLFVLDGRVIESRLNDDGTPTEFDHYAMVVVGRGPNPTATIVFVGICNSMSIGNIEAEFQHPREGAQPPERHGSIYSEGIANLHAIDAIAEFLAGTAAPAAKRRAA